MGTSTFQFRSFGLFKNLNLLDINPFTEHNSFYILNFIFFISILPPLSIKIL